MQSLDLRGRGARFLAAALIVSEILTVLALGLFAYLGTFTRYLAGDYCEAVQVTDVGVIKTLIWRYQYASDRYSNLLFDAVSEFLAPRNVRIVPVVMIALWTMLLIWLVRELRLFVGLKWPLLIDILVGSLMAFFPILEAPNRFQTLYWRSGVAVHFAPLVYLTAFVALLLLVIRRMAGRSLPLWLGVACFVIAFFGGGFSEPPDAMLIVGSLIALVAVWFWVKGPRRRPALHALAWTLGGGLLALAVMAFSPGNALRLETPPPTFPVLVYRTLLYSVLFIVDSINTLPLPTLVSLGMAALLFYILFANEPALSAVQRRRILIPMAVTLLLMYALIAASFAPSVYGQSYPVERARFAGRWMMTSATILEGACLGILLAQWRMLRSRPVLVNLAGLVLVLGAVYVLRGAGNVLQADLPYARKWAAAWDVREAKILRAKAHGRQNLIVKQLPGFENVRELSPRRRVWINQCAARFYGVESISAPQQEDFP